MDHVFRKILCPVDFDDNSMAALDIACKIAAQNDASLCLMHVVPFPVAPLTPGDVGVVPSSFLIWEQDAKVKLQEIGRKRIPSTVQYEVLSQIGLPVEVIIRAEAERGVDLVVMATHGRSRSALGHFFIGSVAERVVRESQCPVLIVPPR
jgi:nucleotide-binding universal stress UspA family protein